MEIKFEIHPHQEKGTFFLKDGSQVDFTIKETEVQVGDYVEGQVSCCPDVVLYIHAQDTNIERQWAVVAYKSDIPRIVLLKNIKHFKGHD